MDIELLGILLLGAAMIGAAGHKGLLRLFDFVQEKAQDAEKTKRLMVGENRPKLLAPGDVTKDGFRIGTVHGQPPYRHMVGGTTEKEPVSFLSLGADERFRRFTFAVNELEDLPEEQIAAMADTLELETLMDVISNDDFDSPRECAAIRAFALRDSEADIIALATLIEEGDDENACYTALECVKKKGPVTDQLISAVITCVDGECRWNVETTEEEDDEYVELVVEDGGEVVEVEADILVSTNEGCAAVVRSERPTGEQVDNKVAVIELAKSILQTWKEEHSQRLCDFVLNRK